MTNEFSDGFDRILVDASTIEAVRNVERHGKLGTLWETIEGSGFCDALVDEASGGAGLALSQVEPLIALAGRHLLPAPFAETMFARALLTRSGIEPPAGPIVLAHAAPSRGALTAGNVAFARVAAHALVACGERTFLLTLDDAAIERDGTAYDLSATLSWPSAETGVALALDPDIVLNCAASLTAAQMAGALGKLLDLTLGYASERKQFGRAIGGFQAVQHQISTMSEHVAAATMASRIAFATAGQSPSPLGTAAAKLAASEAVRQTVPIAHAIHGAIGISEEHPLHVHTRRLHLWRAAFGAERAWAARLAAARLDHGAGSTVDFIREAIFAETAARPAGKPETRPETTNVAAVRG